MSESEDTKHTPGPWAKFESSSAFKDECWQDFWYCGVKSVKTNRTICQMAGTDTEEEERANATLIAQAPAMMELIRSLRTFLQAMIGEERNATAYGAVTRLTAKDITNDSMDAMPKDLAKRMDMMHWERQCGLMLDATKGFDPQETQGTQEKIVIVRHRQACDICHRPIEKGEACRLERDGRNQEMVYFTHCGCRKENNMDTEERK